VTATSSVRSVVTSSVRGQNIARVSERRKLFRSSDTIDNSPVHDDAYHESATAAVEDQEASLTVKSSMNTSSSDVNDHVIGSISKGRKFRTAIRNPGDGVEGIATAGTVKSSVNTSSVIGSVSKNVNLRPQLVILTRQWRASPQLKPSILP
jgi:hypothetical protein